MSPDDFSAAMAALGPFERAPIVAVAVSGGADSLALTLLADEWAGGRRGRVIGLSVDHGIRPAAAGECRQVGVWLDELGIEHHILDWRAPPPSSGVQAAAREARHRLLTDWCRRNGILHLLLAHHRDDQVETSLMRLQRRSGLDGLAGMSALSSIGGVRLLRPLLDTPKSRLVELLENRGQAWIEDPSNRDPAYRRSQLRRRLSRLSMSDRDGLAATVRALGEHRQAISAMASDLAAVAVDLHPAGYAYLTRSRYGVAPAAVRRRLLARLLMCIGGTRYPPRAGRLAAVDDWLVGPAGDAGRTLAGCRLLPGDERVLICREVGRLKETRRVRPGDAARWDRFSIRIAADNRLSGRGELHLRRLGAEGWRQMDEMAFTTLPRPVRPSLPALWCGDRLLSAPRIPHICCKNDTKALFSAVFDPHHPLVSASFTLA